jgi:glycosyltransferase involved in cell wall biosynthesis
MSEDSTMRALVVLTQPPLPEGGAPGRTALGLLRGLAEHGVEVRAIAARRAFSVPGDVPADLPVEVVDVEPPGPFRARLQRVTRPLGELTGAFSERVRAAAADADLVHLEETETVWCDEGIAKPSLVHVHYLARLDRGFGAPWSKQFREVLDATRAERAAVRRHRWVVASSPIVASKLPREVVVAPLSLDPSLYRPAPLDGPSTAGLIGTAAWPPTAAALRVLRENVWPRVQAPEASLIIAGRGTERFGGIGEVASARALFQRLSLLLFPLPRGSGMKVKVLEAMASGVPVVTTPAGAEGIQPSNGVIVETDPDRLAAAARELLTDEAARRERGAAARADFERNYSPGPATAPLIELYERMLG